MGALERQVAGTHYKGFAIQPMEFSVRNRWDAAAHTTLKYLSRFRGKGGLEDLHKARHCLELRADLMPFDNIVPRRYEPKIPMARYIEANGFLGLQEKALLSLERYVHCNRELMLHTVLLAVDELIAAVEAEG